MGKININLIGTLRIFWYQKADKEKLLPEIEAGNFALLNDRERLQNEGYLNSKHYEFCPMIEILGLTANGESILATKGKYVEADRYFSSRIGAGKDDIGYLTDWGVEDVSIGFEVEVEKRFKPSDINLFITTDPNELLSYCIVSDRLLHKLNTIKSYDIFNPRQYIYSGGYFVKGPDLEIIDIKGRV